MTETHWVIVDKASGEVLQRDFVTGGCHPRHAGWDWDAETQACHQVPEAQLDAYTEGLVEWRDGEFVEDLGPMEAALLTRIDVEAGTFRLRFITDVPGQALTYRRKEDEARDFIKGGEGPWPMLEAEAAATEQSIEVLAAEVVEAANRWIALGAAIEASRMGAKKAVGAAATAENKRKAAEVDWLALAAAIAPAVLYSPIRAPEHGANVS